MQLRVITRRVRFNDVKQQIKAFVVSSARVYEIGDLLYVAVAAARTEGAVPLLHQIEHLLPPIRGTHYWHVGHGLSKLSYVVRRQRDKSQQHALLIGYVLHAPHPLQGASFR